MKECNESTIRLKNSAKGKRGRPAKKRTAFSEEKPRVIDRALTIVRGRVTTDSVQVADFFCRSHVSVVKRIKELLEDDAKPETRDEFAPLTMNVLFRNTGTVRTVRAWTMTRAGFALLTESFSWPYAQKLRTAYLDAFTRCEVRHWKTIAPVEPAPEPAVDDAPAPVEPVEPAESTGLVAISDGRTVTTSLKIAKAFDKEHKHVMEAIRKLESPEDFNRSNFRPVEYIDAKGEKRPMYHITRDGFTLLAMGFTGARAMRFKLAYIDAFNRMEAELRGAAQQSTEAREIETTAPDENVLIHLERPELADELIEEMQRKIMLDRTIKDKCKCDFWSILHVVQKMYREI